VTTTAVQLVMTVHDRRPSKCNDFSANLSHSSLFQPVSSPSLW